MIENMILIKRSTYFSWTYRTIVEDYCKDYCTGLLYRTIVQDYCTGLLYRTIVRNLFILFYCIQGSSSVKTGFVLSHLVNHEKRWIYFSWKYYKKTFHRDKEDEDQENYFIFCLLENWFFFVHEFSFKNVIFSFNLISIIRIFLFD